MFMNRIPILLSWTIVLCVDRYQSMHLPQVESPLEAPEVDEMEMDPGTALRHTALFNGLEMVNASDVQELLERTNANASHSLSNTSLADLESDNLTQYLQLRYRERKRQERLLVIQAQILQRLRMSRQPNISANVFSDDEQRRINVIFQRMHDINSHNNPVNDHNGNGHSNPGHDSDRIHHNLHTTMQRLQSFYPSCSLPNNTDKATWESPGSLRIFYQLPRNRYLLSNDLTILLGKLRLYKIATNFGDTWEPNLLELQRYSSLDSMIHDKPTEDINVSVYQYMKPLRYNRKEKKRLIQTRTVHLEHEGWIEFNVLSTLNFWTHHSHRNFGFDVEVEDSLGNKLNPNIFFRNMNCSAAASANRDPPFPNIMEIHPEMIADNESALFDNETYPTLDLQTADISNINSAFYLLPPSSNFNRRSLKKRHVHHQEYVHQRSQSSPVCIAENTYVKFEELGFDDIVIFPDGFEWTFCSGECLSASRAESTTEWTDLVTERTDLLQRLGSFWKLLGKQASHGSPDAHETESRCVGINKRPLQVIYYNENNEIRDTILEDFLPTQCACPNS